MTPKSSPRRSRFLEESDTPYYFSFLLLAHFDGHAEEDLRLGTKILHRIGELEERKHVDEDLDQERTRKYLNHVDTVNWA